MSSRTMVELTSYQYGIGFRTYNREKASRSFYVLRDELSELEYRDEITAHDGSSFAVFRKGTAGKTVHIRFAWLCSSGDQLHGYEENLTLPYGEIAAFAENSRMGGGLKHCRILSAADKRSQPRFVFCYAARLHDCLSQKTVRRKLVRFLRDNFNWNGSEEIRFYTDFVPYSFLFQEIRAGRPGLSGGLILHGQENMERAHYSIHT